jgi:hypothetical protein
MRINGDIFRVVFFIYDFSKLIHVGDLRTKTFLIIFSLDSVKRFILFRITNYLLIT